MIAGNDIFQIISTEISDGKIMAVLSVNKNSEIFQGHFPNQPVVPGACILQLVKDVLEDALGIDLRLKKADNIKFSNIVVPKDEQSLQLFVSYKTVEESTFGVNAKLSEGDVVCFKFQGSFVLQ